MASKKNDKGDLSSIPIRILIIDDDEAHAEAVADCLERVGSDCTVATSGESGAKLIESENYDVVITDLKMDDLDGLQILARTREELPDAEVIVLTGHGSIHSAVTAMQHGANTYLTKPLDINELRTAVEKASDRLRLIRRNAELRRQLDEKFGFEGVIGTSPQMKKVIDILKSVAPTEASVLITGENGTGKELVARALHQNSPRKNKPFVPINISAIPESILESELFGHEAGAFTGAQTRRIGKFEHANGGTLFLDEVGEMPIDTQIKLLRVLEERKITRLGSNDENPVNVRLVAATNADLQELVAAEAVSQRPVLSPQSRHDLPAAAPRTPGRYCPALGSFSEGLVRAERQGGFGRVQGGPAGDDGLRLAGQHPRTAKHAWKPCSSWMPTASWTWTICRRRLPSLRAAARTASPRKFPREPTRWSAGRFRKSSGITSSGPWNSPKANARKPPTSWASANARCIAKSKIMN